MSKAATITAFIEPEISAPSTMKKTSTSASNGSYIQFSRNNEVLFSSYINSVGPLANELNVASNGTWNWNPPIDTNGADQYSITMKAPNQLVKDNYFWSSSFIWSNKRDSGGYIGMQTKVSPIGGARGAIFSIWNTTIAEASTGGVTQPFSGEGVGMQTAHSINWQWNRDYVLKIERITSRSDASNNWWSGTILDSVTGVSTEIGRIRTPTSWGNMLPNNTFLERYGSLNTCGNFEASTGEFTKLQARSSSTMYYPKSVSVEVRQYTDCKNVISANTISSGYRVQVSPGTK